MEIAFMTVLMVLLSGIVGLMVAGYVVDRRREDEQRRDLMSLKNMAIALVNQHEDDRASRTRLENLATASTKDIETIKIEWGKHKTVDNDKVYQHSRDWRKEWEDELSKLSPTVRKDISDDDRAYEQIHKHKRTITEKMFKDVETLAQRGA